MDVRYRLMVVGILAAAPFVRPGTADACTVISISKPQELVEHATSIIHVKVLGMCDELGGPCVQLPSSSSSSAAATARPYAPGWPPVAAPPAPNSYPALIASAYKPVAVEVVEVLKGPAITGRFAIRGRLVTQDDFNDREPPYNFVRRGGRSGNCYAYTYRRDAEYLLFLREKDDVLTPYWASLAPVNEQIRSKDDPWITWVREQLAASGK